MTVNSTISHRAGRPPRHDLADLRRAEILEAATTVFSRRGFAATDVQEIADATGVGKGTVYRYFPSKEELFLAAVDQGMRDLKASVDAVVAKAEQPLERIAAGVRSYLKFFNDRPQIVELLVQERAYFRDRKTHTYFIHRDANMGPWHELFRELIRAGLVRELPVERIVEVISDLLYGTMFTNHFVGRKKSPLQQSQDVLDILFRGILTESERSSHE